MENAKMNSLIAQYPLVKDLVALKETTWFNPGTTSLAEGLPYVGLTEQDVQDAHARLSRFAPYLAKAFPETAAFPENAAARPRAGPWARDSEAW